MAKYCSNCGKEIKEEAVFCTNCGTKQAKETTTKAKTINTVNNTEVKPKSKVAAGLLGIFLGALGIHNFYLGYIGKGLAQLLITVLTCGFLSFATGIWGLIEGILILTGSINVDAYGNELVD